jgi:hypothetical protein
VTGALDVGEWNAGGCAALVVADGDQHGRVWFNGHHPGWSSTMPYHREWQPLDFLDWYEDWLDDRLQPGAMRRNPDRPLAAATHLDFCYPRSPIVPAWVWRCARVRELSFWHNDPVALPAALGGLRELRRLTLRCPLTTLPAAIGRLRRLEAVNLGFCYLPALPDELCRLSRMRTLNLDGNSLRCLPAHMGDLQRLEWLTVRWNRLDALPGSFAELRELRVLSLDQNRLVRLPARFHQLARLGGLDLGRNPIDLAATCEVLARLPRLRMLVLPALAPAADLAPLAALGGLRRLTLHAATRTQRAAIQRLLPDVELRLMGGGEW